MGNPRIHPPAFDPAALPRLTPALRDDPAPTFTNPLYEGADPWVTKHDGIYYSCNTTHQGRVEVWRSDSLTNRGTRSIVWTPPARGWNTSQVWAPELHRIRGRWYIYYAASTGRNRNHRMGVLTATADDPQSPFTDTAQLYTGDSPRTGARNRWAIDGTVLQLPTSPARGDRFRDHQLSPSSLTSDHRPLTSLFFLWSGWEDARDVQHLYIAPMSDPCTVSGPRVRLANNDDHPWEHVSHSRKERGLNEAPQVLIHHNRLFVIYSASGSWQPTYNLGLLHTTLDCDPLNPASWTKHPTPLFSPTSEVFGPGHCSFTTSPDDSEHWLLYHAKRTRRENWHRDVRLQSFTFTADGLPHFGTPIPPRTALRRPAGELPIHPQLPKAA